MYGDHRCRPPGATFGRWSADPESGDAARTPREPRENPPLTPFIAYVPPTTVANQSLIEFEMIGTGFQPGEPLTIQLKPMAATNQLNTVLPTVTSRVDAADPDG